MDLKFPEADFREEWFVLSKGKLIQFYVSPPFSNEQIKANIIIFSNLRTSKTRRNAG